MTDPFEPNDLSHLSDEEFLALCPLGEHALDRPPLWQVLINAGDPPCTMQEMAAAEIRALRDWLVPEESIEDAPGRFVNGCCLEDRQRLRALLTAEADRAERGEVEP